MAKFILSAFADEAGSSLSEQIAALKRNGIHYIEPRFIDGKPILTLTDDELHAVKCELDKNGITVGSLGSPIGKYPIEEPFEIHMKDHLRALEVAKLLGTTRIRMFSFFVKGDEIDKYRGEVIYRMKELVRVAKENGITLCHENESDIYGQNPREVRELLTEIPTLRGIFDPANYRMNGQDVIDGINATLINLGYLHIKDAIYESQLIVPAGDGEGRIGEVLNIVDEASDADVFLTLEPHLFLFDAYNGIDKHELKNKYTFNNNSESFDFAANALKALLKSEGFKEGDIGIWTR